MPRSPHRRPPRRGPAVASPPLQPRMRLPANSCARQRSVGPGRAGPGRPPEAGRAVSGTWCVPSREQARAPQVEKSPPRSLSTRRREAGTSLSAGRAAVPAARRAARCPAAPLPRGRRSAAARRRRRPPLSFAKDGPEVTAGSRPPPAAAPSPPRPPPPAARLTPRARCPPARRRGLTLAAMLCPAQPPPSLPSLPFRPRQAASPPAHQPASAGRHRSPGTDGARGAASPLAAPPGPARPGAARVIARHGAASGPAAAGAMRRQRPRSLGVPAASRPYSL